VKNEERRMAKLRTLFMLLLCVKVGIDVSWFVSVGLLLLSAIIEYENLRLRQQDEALTQLANTVGLILMNTRLSVIPPQVKFEKTHEPVD
jgi:hypothetical protein